MNYLSLAALGAILVTAWKSIKEVLERIQSLFIVRVLLEKEANVALMHLIWNEFSKSSCIFRAIGYDKNAW